MTRVSIIITCYNKGQYVADAINSALLQTYEDIEIVCVNDGSSDNSSEIIRTFANKYKNILFFDNQENKGVIFARNMAIDAATGKYIFPLDADDTIDTTYIEKAAKILDENPDIGVVTSEAKIFGAKNKKYRLPEFDKETMLFENCIFSSSMFRKADFIDVGRYKENMAYGCEDWDLWLSFMENNYNVYRIPEVLFNYRVLIEKQRSNFAQENKNIWLKNMVKNHIDLYFDSANFAEAVTCNVKQLKKKYKTYKKGFNILLQLSIAEFLALFIILAIIFRNWI